MSEFEFVRRSWRNRAYIRRKPYTRGFPTLYQRRQRYALAKIAHENAGAVGTVQYGDKTIPVTAYGVAKALSGRKFAPPKPKPVPELLINLIPIFEAIGKAVESHRFLNRDLIPKLLEEQHKQKPPKLLRWQRFHEEKNKKEKLKKKVAA